MQSASTLNPIPSTSVIPQTSNIRKFCYDFLTGGCAAVVSKTAVAPLERVKLLLQLQDASAAITESKRYNGIVDVLRRVPKEQGVLSLWRGNGTNVIRYFPTQALNFAFKDMYKKMFTTRHYDRQHDFWKLFFINIGSGALAGGSTACFVYPLDFARTHLATDIGKGTTRKYHGLFDVFKKTWKSDGPIGLYRGFWAYVGGIVIYRAGYFGLFDQAKVYHGKELPFWLAYLYAQCVTITMSLMLYPTDTIRRRMMMQSGRKERLYTGYVDCAMKSGFFGCYKGFGANVLRSIGGALLLASYDEIQKILHTKH